MVADGPALLQATTLTVGLDAVAAGSGRGGGGGVNIMAFSVHPFGNSLQSTKQLRTVGLRAGYEWGGRVLPAGVEASSRDLVRPHCLSYKEKHHVGLSQVLLRAHIATLSLVPVSPPGPQGQAIPRPSSRAVTSTSHSYCRGLRSSAFVAVVAVHF